MKDTVDLIVKIRKDNASVVKPALNKRGIIHFGDIFLCVFVGVAAFVSLQEGSGSIPAMWSLQGAKLFFDVW